MTYLVVWIFSEFICVEVIVVSTVTALAACVALSAESRCFFAAILAFKHHLANSPGHRSF